MKIIVVVAAAVLLLGVIMATNVTAQEGQGQPRPGISALLARVAQILNIPEQDLADAFNQARQELRDEALSQRLDRLVQEGLLTQAEADEIEAWLAGKPEALKGLPRLIAIDPEKAAEVLDKAVEQGRLTQAEADEIAAWLAEKPAALDEDVLRALLGKPVKALRPGPRPQMKAIGPQTIERFLDRAVEQGRLTEEEAEQIEEWLEDKPEALDGKMLPGVIRFIAARAGNLGPEDVEQFLAGAVEKGVLSQGEADEILAWLADKPEALDRDLLRGAMGAIAPAIARKALGAGTGPGNGIQPGFMKPRPDKTPQPFRSMGKANGFR